MAFSANSPSSGSPLPSLLLPPRHKPFVRCRNVNSYEKIEKIGQGTFGEVFKGRNKETDQMVALKKVLMKNEREGFPLTALREIKILRQLHHENVLSLLEIVHSAATDYNRQRGSIYMVFEYMDHDLGGLLNRGIQFTPSEVMCLSNQLLCGVHHIHISKIIHRDMKVANLLLNKKGTLKIADFGLARAVIQDAKYTSTVCTRWYRPPELLLGERNYTSAIDIWGVGCIIAELFTGRPILQGGVQDAVDEADNDLDQLIETCKLCGTPTQESWPGFDSLPGGGFIFPKERYPRNVKRRFKQTFKVDCPLGIEFVDYLLVMDPKKRPTAHQALDHDFFWSDPKPCKPEEMRNFGADSHEWGVPASTTRLDKLKKKGAVHDQWQKRKAQQQQQQQQQQLQQQQQQQKSQAGKPQNQRRQQQHRPHQQQAQQGRGGRAQGGHHNRGLHAPQQQQQQNRGRQQNPHHRAPHMQQQQQQQQRHKPHDGRPPQRPIKPTKHKPHHNQQRDFHTPQQQSWYGDDTRAGHRGAHQHDNDRWGDDASRFQFSSAPRPQHHQAKRKAEGRNDGFNKRTKDDWDS